MLTRPLNGAPAGVAEIPAVKQVYEKIAVVRHAPALDSGRVEGALWQLAGEAVTLDGTDTITSDLLVPGTPNVSVSGTPTYGGTVAGTESAQPAGYAVTITGSATLRHLVTRTDPIQLSPVAAPPAPAVARDVSLTQAGQTVGDFSTLRHLTLSGKAGAVSVPPGTYGRFAASSNTAFVLGVENSQQPSAYNLESLSLSGNSELRVVGPVLLTVSNGVTLTGSTAGSGNDPRQLVLQVSGGGVGVGGGGVLYAVVRAPQSVVTVDGKGRVRGTVSCDRLTVAGGGVLQVTEADLPPPPVNRFPTVNAGPDQTITLPTDTVSLSGSASDDGLPAGSTLSTAWSKLSGPGAVTFADASSPATTATFNADGTYVLRLSASDTQLTGSGDVLVKVIASYQGQPGGVFVTGHDADDHSQGPGLPGIGAQHVVQRAIQYVTYNKTAPKILLATDLRNPGGDQSDPRGGLRVSGYSTFDVADYGSGTPGVFDLHTVNFSNYDVVVVASDFGCWLRQDELDVLNARSAELIDYVNQGGGIVAFAESGGRPVPPGTYPGATHDRFRFVPFVVSSEDFHEAETGITVTPDGAATGLTNDDVSGNFSHNIFTTTGGMTVIDRDPFNQILSLAVRGKHISTDGIGNDAPVVSAGAGRTITLPNGVALAGVASDDGLPAGSSLAILWRKISGPGTVTFDSPNQVNTQAFFSDPGTYTLRLSASDGQLSSFSDVAVTVNPTGQFVVVNAGPDQAIYLPNAASLQAAVSDGRVSTAQPLTLRWSVVDGPGPVTFSNPSALATAAAFGAAGLYTLRFSAGDAQYTGTDDLVVKVRPQPLNFGDDFDDNTNDPSKWFYGPGITERNQQLQIDVPDSASLSEFVSAVPVDMTADGAYVRFEIPDYADPSQSNNRIIYWRMQASEGHWFQWVYNNGGVHMYLDNTLLVTNTRARFWRVIHFAANDRVNYDMSEDGVSWVNRYSLVGPYSFTLDRMTFRLIVGAQGPGAAGTVKIDNVNSNIPLIKPNQPPTPVTGGPYRATVGVSLQLDGSRSTDPGDVITSYAWDFGDGSTGAGATPTHTYADAGLYTVRLTVTDLDGATGTAATTATVVPPNQAPSVNAGADQTITLPSSASLSGSVSDDGLPSGGALTAQWSVVSGPGAVAFADAHAASTSATFGQPGAYVLRLSASDTQLTSSDDVTVNVTAPNAAPTVSAGADETITLPTNTALLVGTISDDGLPQGRSVSARWRKVGGPGDVTFADANAAQTTATFSAAGNYVLRLTADDSDLSASDEVIITVKPAPVNQPPTVEAGPDQSISLPNQASLAGQAADDGLPSGSTLTYSWSELSGPGAVTFSNPASLATAAAFAAEGVYMLRLTASDSQLSSSDTLTVTVHAAGTNNAPVVSAGRPHHIVAGRAPAA